MTERVEPQPDWADEKLVDLCLQGSDGAWRSLVDKYKKLVYAVVSRYGTTPEEAADLFQSVWLDVFNDLPRLRNRNAVKPWLISLVRNKCYHWKQKKLQRGGHEIRSEEPGSLDHLAVEDPDFADQLLRDQLLREAIAALPDRCREMVHLLFFAEPPLAYKEVAEQLGLAVGSIGFVRGRCLTKLEKALTALGLTEVDL